MYILEAGPPGLIANSTKSFHLGCSQYKLLVCVIVAPEAIEFSIKLYLCYGELYLQNQGQVDVLLKVFPRPSLVKIVILNANLGAPRW